MEEEVIIVQRSHWMTKERFVAWNLKVKGHGRTIAEVEWQQLVHSDEFNTRWKNGEWEMLIVTSETQFTSEMLMDTE